MKRYRISVPDEDAVFNRFAEAQHNFSFSMRAVVKQFVAEYGYVDATCVDMTSSQSTAKPKAAKTEERQFVQPSQNVQVYPTSQPVYAKQQSNQIVPDSDGFIDPNDLL